MLFFCLGVCIKYVLLISSYIGVVGIIFYANIEKIF